MRGSGRLFLFPDGFRRGVIFHPFDGAAGHRPKVQAGDAAVGAESAAVFFKTGAVDVPVMVHHAQTSLDSQIIKAEHIGPLHAEQQDHFCGPYTDTP